jgi:hypothetical protein
MSEIAYYYFLKINDKIFNKSYEFCLSIENQSIDNHNEFN